jgi:hypothetical protein
MSSAWRNSIIETEGFDAAKLLATWRWLVNDSYTILFATQLGDLFLKDSNGQIFWLATDSGELRNVASDESSFFQQLNNPQTVIDWFATPIIDCLIASKMVLAKGQCYTYFTLPILGGSYEPDNFKLVDLQTHFDIWGPIHEQIKEIPDGTEIVFKVTD